MAAPPPRRAEPPQIPPPSPGQLEAERERHLELRCAEARERRSMVRGLLVLALVVLVLSIVRAGLSRVFLPGWWRP